MNITLNKTVVDSLVIKRVGKPTEKARRKFDLSYIAQLVKDNNKSFVITFKVTVHNSAAFKLTTEYTAIFETNEEVSEDFLNTNFAKINAPAIAYPFLRSYISFVILNSGYEPAMLPTINFVEFSKTNFNK